MCLKPVRRTSSSLYEQEARYRNTRNLIFLKCPTSRPDHVPPTLDKNDLALYGPVAGPADIIFAFYWYNEASCILILI